jgi:hypothetical protein
MGGDAPTLEGIYSLIRRTRATFLKEGLCDADWRYNPEII